MRGIRLAREKSARQLLPCEPPLLPPPLCELLPLLLPLACELPLPDSIALLGASQFLFATDYPHDDPGGRMKYKDVQLLRDHPGISEADKEIIRSGSALNMLPA